MTASMADVRWHCARRHTKKHKAPGNCPGLSYSQTIVRPVAPGTTRVTALETRLREDPNATTVRAELESLLGELASLVARQPCPPAPTCWITGSAVTRKWCSPGCWWRGICRNEDR